MGKQRKNASRQVQVALAEASSSEDEDPESATEGKIEKAVPVRTKYDRMFERKNQKQELYRKVVEQSVIAHGGHGGSDSEDEFMTVKRADHELPSHLLVAPDRAADVSKRQLKIGQSKKAMAKTRALGEKLIFDEEGNAHQVYEMKPSDELAKQGIDVVKLGQVFAEEQRGAMKEIDGVDKTVAKLRRKEKKRKQRDREKDVEMGSDRVARTTADDGGDDGYISPVLDLPSFSSSEEQFCPIKRRKEMHTTVPNSLHDDEELALALLRSQRR